MRMISYNNDSKKEKRTVNKKKRKTKSEKGERNNKSQKRKKKKEKNQYFLEQKQWLTMANTIFIRLSRTDMRPQGIRQRHK